MNLISMQRGIFCVIILRSNLRIHLKVKTENSQNFGENELTNLFEVIRFYDLNASLYIVFNANHAVPDHNIKLKFIGHTCFKMS